MGVTGVIVKFGATVALVLATLTYAGAEPQGVTKEKTYPISGATGIELYTSIGEHAAGNGGHIAETSFALTWSRLFDEEGGDCRLVRMRPKLTITYVYPKPTGKLSSDLSRRWDRFAAGLRKHEEVHGRMIRELVTKTETAVAGAIVSDDKNCAKVKREVSRRIDEQAAAHKARSREFDRVELSDGGNVHRLILALVNGD